MEKINSLRLSSQHKEYYAIIGSLLHLNTKSFQVHEILDPLNPEVIIHDTDKVMKAIWTKYQTLFMSELTRPPLAVGRIESVSLETVLAAAKSISTGKGLGIDCIPDTLLKMGDPDVMIKLTELVNIVLERKYVPSPFRLARLHLINKLREGTPGTEDLRPIMISSPVIKLIEAIALSDLKITLEDKINPSQVGFLSGLNTQTHILRLVGRIMDIKASPTFNTGSWLVLFIDFKAAFDKVNHDILFAKLLNTGVRQRTIDILKIL